MIAFLVFRIGRGLGVLICVSMLCFIAFESAPGDIFLEARTNPNVSAETVQALRKQHGLDRQLPGKYAGWAQSVVRGEWGESLSYGVPVWPILKQRAANTLVLSLLAAIIVWIVGLVVSVTAATAGGRSLAICRWITSILTSVPEILIAIGVLMLAAQFGLVSVGGMTSLSASQAEGPGMPGQIMKQLIAPVAALCLAALPQILGHGLAAITAANESSHVGAARSHGIRGLRLLFSYILRAAANPLISSFGLSIGSLLSSTLIVESVMAWPGIGRLLLEATLQRDVYVVLGAMILSAAFVLLGNLIADVLLYFADPRIRHV